MNYALFVAAIVVSVDVARSSGWFGLDSDRNAQLTACAAQFGGPVTFFTPSQEPWWGECRPHLAHLPNVLLTSSYAHRVDIVVMLSPVTCRHIFSIPSPPYTRFAVANDHTPDGVADASTGKPSGYDVCSHLKAGLCTKVKYMYIKHTGPHCGWFPS